MLHPVVRWLARRAIRWFYRDAEFMNAAAIPSSGPVLIVASHGNDLPDILMTFLATNRDVRFVANISAASAWPVRATYRGLGVIPVSRVRDARALKARGEDASALNANAFRKVVELLQEGHAVAIFPEGNVHEYPHLGKLRPGAARMALKAFEKGVTTLKVVPIGYQYEAPSTPRSGLLGLIGTPFDVADWSPTDATKSITEFTHVLRTRLLEVTRNARAQHDASVLSKIAATAGAALSTPSVSPIGAAHAVQRRVSIMSASDSVFVADGVAPQFVEVGQALLAFENAALELNERCVAFGAKSWSARDVADVLSAAGCEGAFSKPPHLLSLILTAPLAVLGWLWHAFPAWLSRTLAVRYAPTPMDIAARTILPGLYIMEAWYVLVPTVLWLMGVQWWWVILLMLVAPWLGDLAFQWRDWMRTWVIVARVRRTSDANRNALRQARSTVMTAWHSLQREAGRAKESAGSA